MHIIRLLSIPVAVAAAAALVPAAAQDRGPRLQPDTAMGLYAPDQHELYDGRFIVRGTRVYQVGTLDDASPWDHMGDDATNVRAVGGTIDLDVNEIGNTGSFRAELELPEGKYVVELDRFHEFSPCQDGGIAAYLFEHGNSGCGDSNRNETRTIIPGATFSIISSQWKSRGADRATRP